MRRKEGTSLSPLSSFPPMRTQTIDQGVGRAHVTLRRARTSGRRRRRTQARSQPERTSAAMDRLLKREPKGAPEERGAPKQAASPAQEATRARIASLESQLLRLKASGRVDQKTNFQVRCLEEDLRKAHSKLRRLLNEAERQRRRRERLRGGVAGLTPYETPRDDSVMTTLKSCTRFQDLVRELNSLGFSLVHQSEDGAADEGDSMPEVDGVRVKVELIEGDEELEPDFKAENTSSSSCSEIPALLPADEEEESPPDPGPPNESYRRWFERQTELQQRWEENLMRQQMELTRSLLESVTTTFLQGVQQILANLGTGRRFHPFSPDPPTS